MRLIHTLSHVKRRVVVTGMGLVTPLGIGVEHVWNRILNGDCAVSALTDEAYKKIPCKVAAFVPMGESPGELDLKTHLSQSDIRSMSLASCFAVFAADEAFRHSKLELKSESEQHRSGVSIGTAIFPSNETLDMWLALREGQYRKVSPYTIPKSLSNMASGYVSMRHQLKGPNHSVSTACATSLHSIGDASRFIEYGDADVMLAGGSEANINPLTIAGFAKARALTTQFNDTPNSASRPFDKDRDGFVMGEGAGVVVLEEYNHAIERGANIYGEILGYGITGDAHHVTAPIKTGDGAIRAMNSAIQHAGVNRTDIGYVNAHATSTPLGDEIESKAISKVFCDHASKIGVSSIKGAVGHLQAAAGSVETIVTVLAVCHGIMPPTINFCETDIQDKLNYIPNKPQPWPEVEKRRLALKNSFGFGGTNGCLCVGQVR